MLHLIDMAIEDVLKQELPELLPGDVTVTLSFVAPSAEPAVGSAIQGRLAPEGVVRTSAVHLLLFDVTKNRALRSGAGGSPEPPTRGRGAPDVWVDATYHVSVTSTGGGAIDAQTEHLALGAVLEALSRHRELPQALLHPRLQADPNPVLGAVLEGAQVQRGEFWQALADKPRAYFTYLVSFALPPPAAVAAGPKVVSYTVNLGRMESG
jgi:hypothetical protein